MNDLTILFYSANKVEEPFASRVREHLLSVIGDTPLVSVTQKPLDFGRNVCVGDIGVSTYNVYRQIMLGCDVARTRFVACAEDDMLYTPSHFALRPPDNGTFIYNKNRWWVEADGRFRWRDRSGMHCCIVATEELYMQLDRRFEKYPDPPEKREDLNGWGEPGRMEWYLKLPKVKLEYVWSDEPVLTFNRPGSLGGVRKTNPTDIIKTELPPWGRADDVWRSFHCESLPSAAVALPVS